MPLMLTGAMLTRSILEETFFFFTVKTKAITEAMLIIKSVLHLSWKSKSYCVGVSDNQAVRVKESSGAPLINGTHLC